MTPMTPTIFCEASRNGAAIIDEPDIENSLFCEPMKMRTPSPPSARVRSSMTSVWASRSEKSRRMRSRSSMRRTILQQPGQLRILDLRFKSRIALGSWVVEAIMPEEFPAVGHRYLVDFSAFRVELYF